MADIFLQGDMSRMLDNRFIVIIGDSIQRGVYKDIVLLLQRNKYLAEGDLRAKGEFSFYGDRLVEGGQMGEMTNGVKYREVRQYQTDYHLVRFYFVTRCYNTYVESILADISKDPHPDVILMNSCLWDISRYGPHGVEQYKKNVATLFKRLNEVVPKTCLVVWNTTLPISKQARGGVLIPAIAFMNSTLRLDILEANFYIHKLACESGINVLDLHYFLRHQLQRRAGDGVHWDRTAHRRITNLILTHIAQAWNMKTPQNAKKRFLSGQMEMGGQFHRGSNPMENSSNSQNAMDRNFNWTNSNHPNQNQGLFNNPQFFKQVCNQMKSNLVQNPGINQNEMSFFTQDVNMNSLLPDIISQQREAFNAEGGQFWNPEPEQIPQGNLINQFRMPEQDYVESPENQNMMSMGSHECVSQLEWQPYRNDQLNCNTRYGSGSRQRDVPYNQRGRRNNAYW